MLKVRAKNACDQWGDWNIKGIWIDGCGVPLKAGSDLFAIIPNPTDDYVEVSLNQSSPVSDERSAGGFTVEVFNQANVLVKQAKSEGNSLIIFTGDLVNGTYIFRILCNKEMYTYEVVVHH